MRTQLGTGVGTGQGLKPSHALDAFPKTARTNPEPAGPPAWRRNLSEVFGEWALVSLVLEAVQLAPVPTRYRTLSGSEVSAQNLATILAYCYAAGTYSSREIEASMRTNSMVRYLCARVFPSRQDLQWFRRSHREQLRQCLAHVLKQAGLLTLMREAAANESRQQGASPQEESQVVESSLQEEVLMAAADERINMAVMMDWADEEY